jgi:hypothetical protein
MANTIDSMMKNNRKTLPFLNQSFEEALAVFMMFLLKGQSPAKMTVP